jgi:acetate kinase
MDDELIVVMNAGSSTLKFSVFRGANVACRGIIERLNDRQADRPRVRIQHNDQTLYDDAIPARDFESAVEWLFQWMNSLIPQFHPLAVGHRVVHGGDKLVRPQRVTPDLVRRLEALIPLAPLHQPQALVPIHFLASRFPNLPQVVCFDTAFHATQSTIERMFAIPREWFDRGIKRYGFHGLSYESLTLRLPQIDPAAAAGRTVALHLGNGASMCAIHAGKSVATTMSFTALDGIPMGTRSGAIDPGAIMHILAQEGMNLKNLSNLLYKQSGLLGISGISSDMRDLLASHDPRAVEAISYFCYRVAREVASLSAAMGGLDAIAFTGGIGQYAAPIRQKICDLCTWLGVQIDPTSNAQNHPILHTPESKVHILIIPADEEGLIAMHVGELLKLPGT